MFKTRKLWVCQASSVGHPCQRRIFPKVLNDRSLRCHVRIGLARSLRCLGLDILPQRNDAHLAFRVLG